PPRSTLFPSTTLFRSCPSCSTVYNIDDKKIPATGANLKCARCKSSFPVRPAAATATAAAAPAAVEQTPAAPPSTGAVPLPGIDQDRKSTRLNSSHVKI